MMRQTIVILLLTSLLTASEYAVVTSVQSQIETLEKKAIKDLFLKKRTFKGSTELFAINLAPTHAARAAFESKVLTMDRDELNEYWIVSHYKGIKPPLVQRSVAGVREFVKKPPKLYRLPPKIDAGCRSEGAP